MIKQGDCLELMPRLEAMSIDLIACDPPYCVGASSNGTKSTFTDFNLMRPFFEELFNQWRRVLKVGGHVYCCTDWRTYPFLYPLMIKSLKVRNVVVWEHMLMRPGNWYRGSYELIMFAINGEGKRQFDGGERDVWQIKNGAAASITKRLHPSQKPVELMSRMIKNSTQEGEVVLDCFMGSGTTAIAAMNLNRRFIGIEIEEKFFEIAEQRIAKAVAEREQSLFNLSNKNG